MFFILIIVIICIIYYHTKKIKLNQEQQEKCNQQKDYLEKQENYIQERKQNFYKTLMDIKFYKPHTYEQTTKRKFIKDFPYDIDFKNVTKKTSLKDLENFIVIDVETTGLKPSTDELLEISMIKFIEANPTECLTTLVKPKKAISHETTLINGINNDMVKDAPSVSNIIPDFNNFIKGYNIVGYNLEFDLKFLHCNGIDFFSEKRKYYDCLLLTRKYFKNMTDSFKLDNITTLCNIYRPASHRATDDALATGIIFRDIGKKIIEDN